MANMMEEMIKKDLGPIWLHRMLKASYFKACRIHSCLRGNERNLFCIDCKDNSFCNHCSIIHKGHRIVQVRRSSYSDVIRVSDVNKYIDVSGIQSYMINNARIIFLNERPQGKHGKGICSSYYPSRCDICNRSLLDALQFCSLGCKLEGLKEGHPNATFAVKAQRNGNMLQKLDEGGSSSEMKNGIAGVTETPGTSEEEKKSAEETGPSVAEPPKKRHRRKGVPVRSPLM